MLGDDPGEFDPGNTEAACRALKDSLARVLRECDGVSFVDLVRRCARPAAAALPLSAAVAQEVTTKECEALAAQLGFVQFPTLQYYKAGRLLFQHVGAAGANRQLDEAAMFLGSTPAGELVSEVHNEAELSAFVASCAAPAVAVRGITLSAPCDKQLAVLDVSLAANSPGCVHVYPAVLALAKNMAGAVRFGRLLGDGGAEAAALMAKLRVDAVPTFLFFKPDDNGALNELGRYSGADRMALMAAVLDAQAKTGYALPGPPPRKRMSTAEAKRIAQEAREKAKSRGARSGW